MDGDRFSALWQRNLSSVSSADSAAVFSLLSKNYQDPVRYYHDAQHINDCLEWLDRYRDQVEDPDAVELAIWFHDACYSPDPAGHEQRGIDLLRRLAAAKMEPQRLDKVCAIIGLTDHQQPTHDLEQALMLDIDLSSFCRPWRHYLRDTARCRAEQKKLKSIEYCACQLGFLRQLAGREQIYYHPQFRAAHEADARRNIARLIALFEARAARLLNSPHHS